MYGVANWEELNRVLENLQTDLDTLMNRVKHLELIVKGRRPKNSEEVASVDPKFVELKSVGPELVRWKKLHSNAVVPTKGTPSAAAWDLYCVEDLVLVPGEQARVSTRIACAIPEGYYGQILGRSGLAGRGIIVLGGVIDSDYRGELVVMLKNLGPLEVGFSAGDRIAQMAIVKIGTMGGEVVDTLDDTVRGDKGFGSTGK